MHDDWAIGGALMMNELPNASCEFWNASPTRTLPRVRFREVLQGARGVTDRDV
jgi:hypothetical protein